MAEMFEITKAKDGDYHFHLKSSDGHILLASQMYKEKTSAEHGIESIKKNATNDHGYELKESHNGQYMFNLKAANHQVIGTSHLYKTVEARDLAVAAVKAGAPAAPVHDQTT